MPPNPVGTYCNSLSTNYWQHKVLVKFRIFCCCWSMHRCSYNLKSRQRYRKHQHCFSATFSKWGKFCQREKFYVWVVNFKPIKLVYCMCVKSKCIHFMNFLKHIEAWWGQLCKNVAEWWIAMINMCRQYNIIIVSYHTCPTWGVGRHALLENLTQPSLLFWVGRSCPESL